MKVALYSRADSSKIDRMVASLGLLGIDFVLNPEQIDGVGFDLAISLGGDGTFLNAVRRMGTNHCADYLPIVGINSGRLGFLATGSVDCCDEILKSLIDKDYRVEQRTMLEVDGVEGVVSNRALNEFTIQKRGVSMVEIEISIDGADVASYWADGVIVSTPTGSTAYSMSVGGAIVVPSASCFVISPVAPHNLSLRPLVVPDSSVIEIRAKSRNGKGVIATIDNSECVNVEGQKFRLTKSAKKLQVIITGQTTYYDTLREKLHWGVDIRN